jgi:phosphatidylglycerophosphate synthase
MVTQVVAIFLLLLGRTHPLFRMPGSIALWVAMIVALVSGVDYFRRFWRDLLRTAPVPKVEKPPDEEPRRLAG